MIDLAKTQELDVLTQTERENFNITEWENLYWLAKFEKDGCGWTAQAEMGSRVKANDFPVKPIEAAPDWKGKFYKDNWVWKGIKWITAMLTGAEMIIDIVTPEGQFNPMLEPLEFEVNYAADKFDITHNDDATAGEKYWKGEGWMYCYWNTRKRDAFYQTGMPQFIPIQAEKISIDPATTMRDKSDMRYLFHEEWYDTATVKMRYPKFADLIVSTPKNDNANATNLTRLVTVQYKKTVRSHKVFITHQVTGILKEFPLIELQAILKSQASNPEAIDEYRKQLEAGDTILEFKQWLLNMWILPEGCEITPPVEGEEETVWQATYFPDATIVLSPPTYVWHKFTYINLPGFKLDNKPLCFGLCHYLADMLEISTALMTTLTIQAIKYYIVKEQIVKGALINEEEYLKNGHKIGVNPLVDPAWQKMNPGQSAVKPLDMPQFPQALLKLDEMIKNAQQTTTGVIDVVMGQQEYSGQPGIAIAQLQQASRVYFKDDVQDYQRFNQTKVEWLMDMICRFRNYPHKIMGLDEEDNEALVDVATNILNELNGKYAAVHVSIVENWEVVKAIEKENVMALYQLGLVDGEYVLDKHDVTNPHKQIVRAKTERGDKAIVDTVNENPNLRQIVDLVMQTGKDIEPQNAGPVNQ